MIFWSLLAAAIAYLLLVAFIFSAYFAWRDRRWDRLDEAKHLREFAAASALARYQHRPDHICGLIGETNLVHIDVRCIAWTMMVGSAATELRRQRIRAVLQKLAEKKRAEAPTSARNSHPIH